MLDRFIAGDAARVAALPTRADGRSQTPQAIAPWGSGDEDEPPFVPPPVEQVR
jgi:hypothetical protein